VHLVQIILPLFDNDGQPVARREFGAVRAELTSRFGGATAYTRAPAQGTWEDDEGRIRHDDVIVLEVMAESLDRTWWSGYRAELAARFRQDEVVVRASAMEIL
jgi:hypothetical protein